MVVQLLVVACKLHLLDLTRPSQTWMSPHHIVVALGYMLPCVDNNQEVKGGRKREVESLNGQAQSHDCKLHPCAIAPIGTYAEGLL